MNVLLTQLFFHACGLLGKLFTFLCFLLMPFNVLPVSDCLLSCQAFLSPVILFDITELLSGSVKQCLV